MTKTFASLLEYYVVTYANKEAGLSPQTLRSYYSAIEQYVLWICKTEEITTVDINFSYFSKDRIRRFLLYLEEDQHVSISTRNQRRAAIVSFLGYAKDFCPVYTNTYVEAQTIKVKKAPKPDKSFLTVDEYRIILESIDITSYNGLMHYLLIAVLYDTAARVDEAVNMNFEDFSFGKENSVIIYGKGSKYRRIYLTSHSVKLIKEYQTRTSHTKGALFLNKYHKRISDSGINYVLKKYATIAVKASPSLMQKKVSSHTLRRSKATHMLLNGASLPVIQRFLGHESIQTTQAYLDAGSEAMSKAVEVAEKKLLDSGVAVPTVTNWHDSDILKKLKQMVNK
jgi:integrase/recombinase XerD